MIDVCIMQMYLGLLVVLFHLIWLIWLTSSSPEVLCCANYSVIDGFIQYLRESLSASAFYPVRERPRLYSNVHEPACGLSSIKERHPTVWTQHRPTGIMASVLSIAYSTDELSGSFYHKISTAAFSHLSRLASPLSAPNTGYSMYEALTRCLFRARRNSEGFCKRAARFVEVLLSAQRIAYQVAVLHSISRCVNLPRWSSFQPTNNVSNPLSRNVLT